MAYTWRATYCFDYPLLDTPIDLGDIRLYPGPPELDSKPHAVHFYEFQTESVDRNGQVEARSKYLERLEKLSELSVLCPYYTEVSFHSAVLIDADGTAGYPPSGINFNFGGKPYVPPGQPPKKLREELEQAAQPFIKLQNLNSVVGESISRALRWLYRANDYRLSADDQLIYRWIAFNSLYSLLDDLEGINRSERQSVRNFEEKFRPNIGTIRNSAVQKLAASGLKLIRGNNKDVSKNLTQALVGTDLITQCALECVYAARCSLFHGAEGQVSHVPNAALQAAASFLETYLKQAIGSLVSFCENIQKGSP